MSPIYDINGLILRAFCLEHVLAAVGPHESLDAAQLGKQPSYAFFVIGVTLRAHNDPPPVVT
jgi:hypothetical protein